MVTIAMTSTREKEIHRTRLMIVWRLCRSCRRSESLAASTRHPEESGAQTPSRASLSIATPRTTQTLRTPHRAPKRNRPISLPESPFLGSRTPTKNSINLGDLGNLGRPSSSRELLSAGSTKRSSRSKTTSRWRFRSGCRSSPRGGARGCPR